jgi:hypothetical protein
MPKIKILVVDNNGERGQANAFSFHQNGAETYLYDPSKSQRNQVPEWDNNIILPSDFDLLILHDNNSSDWTKLKRSASYIIRYTGGDYKNLEHPTIQKRIIDKNYAISENEAKQVIDWINAGANSDELPEILSSSIEILPALSILCQGYLMAYYAYSKDKNILEFMEKIGWNNLSEDIKKILENQISEQKINEINKSDQWFKIYEIDNESTNQTTDIYQKLKKEYKKLTQKDDFDDNLNEFLKSISICDNSQENKQDNNQAKLIEITPEIVARAYNVISSVLTK